MLVFILPSTFFFLPEVKLVGSKVSAVYCVRTNQEICHLYFHRSFIICTIQKGYLMPFKCWHILIKSICLTIPEFWIRAHWRNRNKNPLKKIYNKIREQPLIIMYWRICACIRILLTNVCWFPMKIFQVLGVSVKKSSHRKYTHFRFWFYLISIFAIANEEKQTRRLWLKKKNWIASFILNQNLFCVLFSFDNVCHCCEYQINI